MMTAYTLVSVLVSIESGWTDVAAQLPVAVDTLRTQLADLA